MNLFELLVIGAGASSAAWGWQQRARARYEHGIRGFDADADIALSVARHVAGDRVLAPLHVLYGLLQDEAIVAAIRTLGGDPEAIEARVLDALDRADGDCRPLLGRALLRAAHHESKATCRDLWWSLARTPDAAQLGDLAPKLLFVLVHGAAEPTPPNAPEVHLVLRNDDYTTFELVQGVLVEVLGLDVATAQAKAMETHREGRAIVARLDAATAKAKIAAIRERALAAGAPLWVGAEAA